VYNIRENGSNGAKFSMIMYIVGQKQRASNFLPRSVAMAMAACVHSRS